ncbi:E3 ubiquitin protein ligase DRIP2-like [Brachypodium distachyon]|uniref:E3 ubiquitin protein ligase DRIP2-like n=1 Tax=Brachypodium distachyon TaxID=15368 RepID=UPI00052FF9F7|nr:E3 ubiquitin protein ligase DRIP2-like [Brachypodium distachyon]|eukprot:XP_010229487.1 E3 ubiquitin protein ligase DRIP2-like [Brachypodium distachyon]
MGSRAGDRIGVRRGVLAGPLTCPLCRVLLRDAMAFKECLHTFCRECIMKKIDDEEIESCPVCDIFLGVAPEEKLRPDYKIQALRNKLFPPKRAEVDASTVPTVVETSRTTSVNNNGTKMASANEKQSANGEVPIRKGNTAEKMTTIGTRVREASGKKSLKSGPKSDAADSLRDGITTPVWFSLVTSPHQPEEKLLPQITNSYLKIKDGTMKVSSIKRYIMQKLKLASDDEVEILCHDITVCSSMTVKDLLGLWLSHQPTQEVPVGTPAKQFVMVLSYRRSVAA